VLGANVESRGRVFQIPSQPPPKNLLQSAIDAFNRAQFQVAEGHCKELLKTEPKRKEALLLMARVVLEQSRLSEVEPWLERAAAAGASDVDLLMARAGLRWREGRDEDVIAMCDRALTIRPDHLDASLRAANAERRLRRYEAAIKRLAPHTHNPVAATIAAWCYLDLDQPQPAVNLCLPCTLTSMGATVKSNLMHVLGLAYEGLGKYDLALQAYTASNEAIPLSVPEAGLRRDINNLKNYFTRERIASAPKPSVRTARPVFIAAMPRSGTTLVDRIIAAHPECAGAGETRALRGQVQEWTGWPEVVGSFTSADFDRIATRYVAETNRFGSAAVRMADKHLLNWTMVGLVSMAFPDARVIHLRRDMADTGISCFERLRPGQVAWSRSLRLIGVALKACDVLMEHWRQVATIPILDVQYETLVRQPESETRRIIDFLGIPWNDACLAHHDRSKAKPRADGSPPPPTLSSEQAAKPIYDKSIGRAQRFGAALDPLRQAYAEPF
jgi:tetratricopeptide (TPR) repeat protein